MRLYPPVVGGTQRKVPAGGRPVTVGSLYVLPRSRSTPVFTLLAVVFPQAPLSTSPSGRSIATPATSRFLTHFGPNDGSLPRVTFVLRTLAFRRTRMLRTSKRNSLCTTSPRSSRSHTGR